MTEKKFMNEKIKHYKNTDEIKNELLQKRDTAYTTMKGKSYYLQYDKEEIFVVVMQKEIAMMNYNYTYKVCFKEDGISFKSVKNFNWIWHFFIFLFPIVVLLVLGEFEFGIILLLLLWIGIYFLGPKKHLYQYFAHIVTGIRNR